MWMDRIEGAGFRGKYDDGDDADGVKCSSKQMGTDGRWYSVGRVCTYCNVDFVHLRYGLEILLLSCPLNDKSEV